MNTTPGKNIPGETKAKGPQHMPRPLVVAVAVVSDYFEDKMRKPMGSNINAHPKATKKVASDTEDPPT